MSKRAKAFKINIELNNCKCCKWQKSPRVMKIWMMANVQNCKQFCRQKASWINKKSKSLQMSKMANGSAGNIIWIKSK